MPCGTQPRKEGDLMITLSTVSRNFQFNSLAEAEIYGRDKIKENCCILGTSGSVLSFKRKGQDQFTRITKQADVCDTPLSQKTC
jgi:hypothetical protein